MPESVVQLHNISKSYGGVTAVDQIALAVYPGEVVVLLGPSGCGKTTTLRLIAGVERPDQGDIWLKGRQVAGKRAWVAPEDRRVGMVFQDYALFPHLSVGANITFGLRGWSSSEKQAALDDMLRLVDLPGFHKRMPHELSGGQQQRVALARALASRPDVLLLDEPFSNLDAALRDQVRSEVGDILHSAGITSVFVTHDQQEALTLADRVVVMFKGHIAQIASPQEIYINPATPQVAAFVGEANFLPGEASGETADCALGTVPLLEAGQGEVTLLLRPEVLTVRADAGVPVVIRRVEFYGHSQRLTVQLDDLTLKVRANALDHYEEGQTVNLTVEGAVKAFA